MERLSPSRGCAGTVAALVLVLSCPAARAADSHDARHEQREKGKAQATQKAPPATKPPLPAFVEKLTVSATVAEERRDPASVTSLGRSEIAQRDRGQDMAMLLAETPNAYAYSDAGNGVGYAYLSLRGFDQRRIAVYVNGVPLNDPESQQVYFIDLADLAGGLATLQVQRGTGTALYGSPAVGGVVNLETGALENVRNGELVLGAGSFGTYRGSLRLSVPFDAGRSALSVRLAHVQSDGYRDPAWTHHDQVQLAYQRVGGDSVLRVNLFGGPERTQLAYLGVPLANLRGEITGDPSLDRRANPLRPGEIDSFFQPQLQVLHDLRLSPSLLLKTTLYAIFGDGYFRQYAPDLAYAPAFPGPATAAFPELSLTDAWQHRAVSKRQYGAIPSLTFDSGRSRLVVGVQATTATSRNDGSVTDAYLCAANAPDGSCASLGAAIAAPLTLYDYRNRKTSLSAFARESFRASDSLSVDLELQATHHAFSMDEDRVRGYSWQSGYSFLTPRVGVNWNASERLNLYASLSTARSEPRFDDIWNPQDTSAAPTALFARADATGLHFSEANARPERLTAVEAGVGYSSGTLRLKADGYWMDFRDELVYAGGIDQDGLPITDNAARSLHRGVELQAAWRAPGAIDLLGQLAVSEDVLEDYVLHYGPGPADSVDYSGNRVALFPTHQARLRASRDFGRARLSFGLRRVGTIYLDNSQNERKDPAARLVPGYVDKLIQPFTLADARAELDLSKPLHALGKSVSLRLEVDNLFDRRYAASGYYYDQNYYYPGATRNAFVTLSVGF
jgi:iron complex outermembrane recepter protein